MIIVLSSWLGGFGLSFLLRVSVGQGWRSPACPEEGQDAGGLVAEQ